MIKALIFDFDGLILDTEMPDYQSWQTVYALFEQSLPIELWGQIVGGTGASDFDPHTYLEQLTGQTLDREEIWLDRRKQYLDQVANQPILPGVTELMNAAEKMKVKLGLASSSPANWVHGHLQRLELFHRFHVIKTADDVVKTKPDPELFNSVLNAFDISGNEAIVFEDSPNGVLAAHAAGIPSVAIPNELTAQLEFEHASLQLNSMADYSLVEMLEKLDI
jgi:HAD superfamily hydrolase (TIGR01509 family)